MLEINFDPSLGLLYLKVKNFRDFFVTADSKKHEKEVRKIRRWFTESIEKSDSKMHHILKEVKGIHFGFGSSVVSDIVARELAKKSTHTCLDFVCFDIFLPSHCDNIVIPECREFFCSFDFWVTRKDVLFVEHIFEKMPSSVEKLSLIIRNYMMPVLNYINLPRTIKILRILEVPNSRDKPMHEYHDEVLQTCRENSLSEDCEFVIEKIEKEKYLVDKPTYLEF